MDLGLLLLRLVVGLLFVGHGTQKLFAWFGGPGIEGASGFMASLRYPKPRFAAIAAGFTEATCGCLLALGFLTPLAAAGIIGVMVNASVAAHAPRGLWNQNGGFELPLVMGSAALAIAFAGPGDWSVEYFLGLRLGGTGYGLFALLLGLCAAMMMLTTRRRVLAALPARAPRRAA
jgi:putative oxidoreductase